MEKIIKKSWVKRMTPFGSRVVGCATDTSDYDYLVLAIFRPSFADMEGTGFEPDSSDPLYGVDFSSWKSGDINLVFTDSEGYFDATLEACDFCKKYKVYDKEDRCKIHAKFRDAYKHSLTLEPFDFI